MVASQHDNFSGTSYFHGQNEHKHLYGEIASVHIVAQKDILCFFAVSSDVCIE